MRQLEAIVGERALPRRPARVPEDLRVRQRHLARPDPHSRRADARGPRGLEPRVGRGARPPGDRDRRCGTMRGGRIARLTLTQRDPLRAWTWSGRSRSRVALGYPDGAGSLPVSLAAPTTTVPAAAGLPAPAVRAAERRRARLRRCSSSMTDSRVVPARSPAKTSRDPLTRGSAWVTLWDDMLERRVDAAAFPRSGAAGAADRDRRAERPAGARATSQRAFWRLLPAGRARRRARRRSKRCCARASTARRRPASSRRGSRRSATSR